MKETKYLSRHISIDNYTNMENTKNELLPYTKTFFKKLSIYLDTSLYYYGSVQRSDYYPKSSDIDVCVFTDNLKSTIFKMQTFLNIPHVDFKKTTYHLNNRIVKGYKVKYEEPDNFLFVEFAIYNESDKQYILEEHRNKIDLPIVISILLVLIKFFYYQIPIIPKKMYYYMKQFLMNTCINKQFIKFMVN